MMKTYGRRLFLFCFLIGLLSVTACAEEPQSTAMEAELGSPFQLKIGQMAQISSAGLTVEFLEVTSDSRCPEEVECVEAGRVSILINVTGESGMVGDYTLILDPRPENPAITTLDGYTITLTEVTPYPVTTDPIESSEYAATFLVTQN